MRTQQYNTIILTAFFALLSFMPAHAETFEAYVQRLSQHPQVESILAGSEALRSQAQGELGLPDPMFMIGMDNMPISDPAFDRFLPTSKVIGFSQAIPNPAAREAKSERYEQMSEKQKLIADYTNARLRFMLISKLAEYESEARKLAIKEAKLKAEDYVSVLGQKIKGAITITDNSQNYNPQPVYASFKTMAMESDAAGPRQTLAAGEITITANVSVSFYLY